jgi:DnaJ-class molecular chaperone
MAIEEIQVPAVTQSGKVNRMRGKGLPGCGAMAHLGAGRPASDPVRLRRVTKLTKEQRSCSSSFANQGREGRSQKSGRGVMDRVAEILQWELGGVRAACCHRKWATRRLPISFARITLRR